jgi:hypothetical protein
LTARYHNLNVEGRANSKRKRPGPRRTAALRNFL